MDGMTDRMMEDAKDMMIRAIEAKARRRVTRLSYRLIRASPKEQELVLSELEFQQWLAETCASCLQRDYGTDR